MPVAHAGIELALTGDPVPGTCNTSGCHHTADLSTVHRAVGCFIWGCHTATGLQRNSCGGPSDANACHRLFSATEHFVEHSADLTGTVGGVTYGFGENRGCLGVCHATDLVVQHASSWSVGTMEGTSGSVCRVCHNNTSDPGNGTYAGLPAVTAAVAGGDRRCIACHWSGLLDGPDAVASPTPACIPDPAFDVSIELHMTADAPKVKKESGTESFDATSTPSSKDTDVVEPGEPTIESAPATSAPVPDKPPASKPAPNKQGTSGQEEACPEEEPGVVCLNCHEVKVKSTNGATSREDDR